MSNAYFQAQAPSKPKHPWLFGAQCRHQATPAGCRGLHSIARFHAAPRTTAESLKVQPHSFSFQVRGHSQAAVASDARSLAGAGPYHFQATRPSPPLPQWLGHCATFALSHRQAPSEAPNCPCLSGATGFWCNLRATLALPRAAPFSGPFLAKFEPPTKALPFPSDLTCAHATVKFLFLPVSSWIAFKPMPVSGTCQATLPCQRGQAMQGDGQGAVSGHTR